MEKREKTQKRNPTPQLTTMVDGSENAKQAMATATSLVDLLEETPTVVSPRQAIVLSAIAEEMKALKVAMGDIVTAVDRIKTANPSLWREISRLRVGTRNLSQIIYACKEYTRGVDELVAVAKDVLPDKVVERLGKNPLDWGEVDETNV